MHRSVVGITIDECTSSGVVVAPEEVLTCFHIIKPLMEYPPDLREIFITSGKKEYSAEIICADASHDLCKLRVPGLEAPPIRLADSPVRVGDTIISVGRPAGHFTKKSGTVVHLNQADDHPLTLFDYQAVEGMSGGALLNKNGELAGIQAFRFAALPLPWVKEMIARKDNAIIPYNIPAKTEIDFYNTTHGLMFRLDDPQNITLYNNATMWAEARPQSFFAQMSVLAKASLVPNLNLKYSAIGKAAKRAYAINPSVSTLKDGAGALFRAGAHKESIVLYKQLVHDDPSHAHQHFADIYYQMRGLPVQQRAGTLAYFEKMLPHVPDQVCEHLGHLCAEMGLHDKAITFLKVCAKSKSLFPISRARAWGGIATAEHNLGHTNASKEALKKMLTQIDLVRAQGLPDHFLIKEFSDIIERMQMKASDVLRR